MSFGAYKQGSWNSMYSLDSISMILYFSQFHSIKNKFESDKIYYRFYSNFKDKVVINKTNR